MTERCQKAYNSLVRAFFEGTLAKFSCSACACGNIIFDAVGKSTTKQDIEDEIFYVNDVTDDPSDERIKRAMERTHEAEKLWAHKRTFQGGKGYEVFTRYAEEVNEAGYTADEFTRIENTFEDNTHFKISTYPYHSEQEILEDQYKGLCAVVDVLLELDKGQEDSPDELKKKFREHPKLVGYAA